MGERPSGESTGRRPRRLVAIGVAVLVLAMSAAVAHAVFGSLTFVEVDKDADGGVVDGLNGALGVAASPDGAHVYVAAVADNAVATFSRDPVTGVLTFVEHETDGVGIVDGLSSASGVAASPGGAHVYVTGEADDAVVTFSRDPATGALTFVEQDEDGISIDGLNGAFGIALSPDGAHVYVTGVNDDAVATFSRDPATGALNFVEREKDGEALVDGLDAARGVAASPDGKHIYVAGQADDAVATFSRDPATGALTFVEQDKDGVGGVDGLDFAQGVAASADGTHVYVAGHDDDAVATFARDPATGALSFVEQDKDGVEGVDGLDGARGVAASPDGAQVYVTSQLDDAVATFSRDPASGALSFVEQDKDGVEGVDGLDAAYGVAASHDGAHVYAVGATDDAIATFAREGPTRAATPRTISFDATKAKKGKKAGKHPLLGVKKGKKARFSGDVSAPQDVAGCEATQTVELQRKKPKQASFTTFKQLQTDPAGQFSTKKKIKKTFQYRAVLGQTAICTDATSGTEKVKAKKRKK